MPLKRGSKLLHRCLDCVEFPRWLICRGLSVALVALILFLFEPATARGLAVHRHGEDVGRQEDALANESSVDVVGPRELVGAATQPLQQADDGHDAEQLAC